MNSSTLIPLVVLSLVLGLYTGVAWTSDQFKRQASPIGRADVLALGLLAIPVAIAATAVGLVLTGFIVNFFIFAALLAIPFTLLSSPQTEKGKRVGRRIVLALVLLFFLGGFEWTIWPWSEDRSELVSWLAFFVNFAQAYLMIWALEWPSLRTLALFSRRNTH